LYFFRAVLHNYPDEWVRVILQNINTAMVSESVLFFGSVAVTPGFERRFVTSRTVTLGIMEIEVMNRVICGEEEISSEIEI
jgi:hypothetical protein